MLMVYNGIIAATAVADDEYQFMTPKYLNKQCDFESIPARGCHLRESYCSLHTCICKPDFPINIADRLCIAKYRNIGEVCTFDQECQTGSKCIGMNNSPKVCKCKNGYIYSEKSKQCIKGLKGASCNKDSDCIGNHMFCSLIMCECKYGYEWFSAEESCLKRAKFGENCDSSINCKVYDEFSECDPFSKKCVCGEFLSRKYTLDEVTRRCISCPIHRYNHSSNTCLPEKTTVEYSLLDESSHERNSHQYVYIALSMAPFIVFALIGFIYRYVNPYGALPETFDQCTERMEASNAFDEMTSPSTVNHHYCLSIDVDENLPGIDNQTTCLIGTTLLPDPPPTYDIASKDLPPSYEEVIAENNVER